MEEKYLEKAHFVRLVQGKNEYCGTLEFTNAFPQLELYSFTTPIMFPADAEISVQLFDFSWATLRKNSDSPRLSSSYTETRHSNTIKSGEVIIGDREWRSSDRVRSVDFKVPGGSEAFRAPDIQSQISKASLGDMPNREIFVSDTSWGKATVYYTAGLRFGSDTFQVQDVRVAFEFSVSRTLDEMDGFFGAVRSFFSVGFGVEVRFQDYIIQPENDGEIELLNGTIVNGGFSLIWPKAPMNTEEQGDRAFQPRSFLRSREPDDRAVFSKCLAYWIARWDDWRGPAAASIYALGQRNTYDGHRLISACKWIETTPGAKQVSVHSIEAMSEVIASAEKTARELNLNLGQRLQGALLPLRTESRREFVERLVAGASSKIRISESLKQEWVKDVVKGFRIRGDFAHERFYHRDSESFSDYVRVTQAIECLGFLLMIDDLPLPEKFERVVDLYPFSDYIYHYH